MQEINKPRGGGGGGMIHKIKTKLEGKLIIKLDYIVILLHSSTFLGYHMSTPMPRIGGSYF